MAKNFDVTVQREGRWWIFTVPELDAVGQARSLAEVPIEARGLIAGWLDSPQSVSVLHDLDDVAAEFGVDIAELRAEIAEEEADE